MDGLEQAGVGLDTRSCPKCQKHLCVKLTKAENSITYSHQPFENEAETITSRYYYKCTNCSHTQAFERYSEKKKKPTVKAINYYDHLPFLNYDK